MNFKLFPQLLIMVTLVTTLTFAKRPKKDKPPKQEKPALTQEQKQVIATNVAQVMGGICTIIQDPRNPYNIGSSVGSMIQALINIIIAKCAKQSLPIDTTRTIQESRDIWCNEISKEITDIIVAENLLFSYNIH